MNYGPKTDGIDHINLYTRGKTRLGRLATNLAELHVAHPTYGRFRTAEGLWYYLKTGKCHEELRAMSGFEAKRHGRTLPSVWNKDFRAEFEIGLREKVLCNKELYELFIESTLPFAHYYVYESKKPDVEPKIIAPKDGAWIIEYLTRLREELK